MGLPLFARQIESTQITHSDSRRPSHSNNGKTERPPVLYCIVLTEPRAVRDCWHRVSLQHSVLDKTTLSNSLMDMVINKTSSVILKCG